MHSSEYPDFISPHELIDTLDDLREELDWTIDPDSPASAQIREQIDHALIAIDDEIDVNHPHHNAPHPFHIPLGAKYDFSGLFLSKDLILTPETIQLAHETIEDVRMQLSALNDA